jgi:hypothetical protein
MASAGCQGEVSGVVAFLQNLVTGSGPKDKDIISYSEFMKCVLKRSENFFVQNFKTSSTAQIGQLKFAQQGQEVVVGSTALAREFAAVEQAMHRGEVVTLASLKPFRTYSWLLSQEQRDSVSGWIAAVCLKVDGEGFAVKPAIADEGVDALVLRSSSAASSSSTALAATGGMSASKAVKKEALKKSESQMHMMSFFGGGPKKH